MKNRIFLFWPKKEKHDSETEACWNSNKNVVNVNIHFTSSLMVRIYLHDNFQMFFFSVTVR